MTTPFHEIIRRPEFERDFKKLSKRFRTLDEDLENLIKHQIILLHKVGIDNRGSFQIPGFPFHDPEIFKVKKFACKALKGRGANTGLRLIYAYFKDADRVELIEIYFKGDKENEDKERILNIYKG
jgi:mRNA-degrading endonuclease RelE of RelBE toxin-antitoxin system